MNPSLLQFILAVLMIASSLVVVFHKNPVANAMALMSTLFFSAFMYVSMQSYFIGAIQILIYAGAVAVLFVFIVMLLDLDSDQSKESYFGMPFVLSAILATAAFAFFSVLILKGGLVESISQNSEAAMSAKGISNHFVSKHMLAFQLTGFLILSAILGAVFFGRYQNKALRGEK